jgi:transposase
MSKSKRRRHSEEFKRESVKLVTKQGYSVAEAARNLGVHVNLLRTWQRKLSAEASEEQDLTEEERMELARLRTENKRLRMERDILKKATAFFASEKA